MPRKSAAAVASAYDVVDVPFVPSRLIPLEQLVESPLNPRKHMQPLTEDFLQSIATKGVDFPILVRPSDKFGAGVKFEIIAGARRFKACQALGRTEIPVTVKPCTDLELIEHALDENLRRKDMHPLDEAQAYLDVQQRDPVYKDLDALGKRFGGWSATYMRDKLKLLRLPAVVREALDQEAITLKHAELIATLPADQHEMGLAECFSGFIFESNPEDDTPGSPREKLIKAKDWTRLAPGLLSTREFQRWARVHGKADLADAGVQQQLLEGLDGAQRDVKVLATLPILSTDQWMSANQEKALGVVPASAWIKVAKGEKHRCASTERGIIGHGMEFARSGRKPVLVDVCRDAKCKTHRPAPSAPKHPASSTSAKPSAAEKAARKKAATETSKRKAEAEAWKKHEPFYLRALGTVYAKKRVDLLDYVKRQTDFRRIEGEFGLKLTTATALHFLELDSLYINSLSGLFIDAKSLGVSKPAVEAEFKRIAPKPEPKADAKKPAKKGGAKK